MRKPTLLLLAAIVAVALPSYARDRSHSYITYDDGGGATIRQSEDGRDVDTRLNMPIFPGDELTTGHRGRIEIRMADGNVIALDRSTSVTFKSILDSYDGDSEQTIVELKYGHVAIQRDDDTKQLLRLDTENASYAASDVALYAVEADSKNHDRVTVFDGAMEVRTPARTMRLRAGEEAHVDDGGMYDLVNAHNTADEFERWFMQRASRSSTAKGRYLDNSLAYSEADLESNGVWYFAADFGGWAWCPRVSSGWRPYYNGYWRHSPSGLLVWVSYDPWGWVPYHYGRWAFEPVKGWVWLPGAAYAPAWVYWMYGPSYIGWAPMGWYDCYRPYYNWAYRPFAHAGFIIGGWSGRVHPGEVDLRPWTFVTPDQLLKRHVDQAALPGESIRDRMRRDGNTGLVSSAPARFGRNEIKDPAAAVGDIYKRGIGGDTNGKKGSGPTDMTPYFRRDPDLSASVRERVVHSQPVQGAIIVPVTPAGGGGPTGVPSPGTPGTLEGRANRGADGTNPRTESPIIPRDGRTTHEDPSVNLRGGNTTNGPANTTGNTNDWRRGRAVDGVTHRDGSQAPAVDTSHTTPASGEVTPVPAPRNDEWRGRAVGHHQDSSPPPTAPASGTNSRDVPRRIIDAIGGAHISRGQAPSNDSKPREHSSGSGSSSRSGNSSGSSSPQPRAERPSSPPPSSQPTHSSPPPSSSPSPDSGSRENKKN